MKLFIFSLLLVLLVSCNKNEDDPDYELLLNTKYSLSVTDIYDIQENSALVVLSSINPDNLNIYQRGVLYDTKSDLTIHSSRRYSYDTKNTEILLVFNKLKNNTVYFIRPYAITEKGLLYYGEVTSFKTIQYPDTVIDFDGNVYHSVKIGKQLWLKENLKTTHTNTGQLITDCFSYGNDAANASKYGKLYTWKAATNEAPPSVTINQGICPAGWHIPGNQEWNTLSMQVGGDSIAGFKLKILGAEGDGLWGEYGGSDEVNFSALPGGYRSSTGIFSGVNNDAYFWTNTVWEKDSNYAYMRRFYYGRSNIAYFFSPEVNKNAAMSVRCVYDRLIEEP